jgi:hypothetical protein
MLLSTSVSTCTGTSVTLTGSCTLGTFYWTDTPITPSLSIIVSPSITTTYNAACYSGVVSSTSTITITVFDGAIISLSSGDWTNPSTWSCSCIPAPCNDVTVATGNIVNIPISLTGRLKNLTVKGTITMKNSSMMKLK